jgi:hypothetical protein
MIYYLFYCVAVTLYRKNRVALLKSIFSKPITLPEGNMPQPTKVVRIKGHARGVGSIDRRILALMVDLAGPGRDKLTTIDQLRTTASQRLGTPEKRMRWALEFANKPLAKLTPGDWLNVQLELAVFRTPWVVGKTPQLSGETAVPVTNRSGIFPEIQQVVAVHKHFNERLQQYARIGGMNFQIPGETLFQVGRGEEGKRTFDFSVQDYVADCVIKLMKLTADFGNLVRICPKDKHGCGLWFLATRTDKVFCNKTCVSRATSRERRARLGKKKEKDHGSL